MDSAWAGTWYTPSGRPSVERRAATDARRVLVLALRAPAGGGVTTDVIAAVAVVVAAVGGGGGEVGGAVPGDRSPLGVCVARCYD